MNTERKGLSRYVSPAGALALSLGTSIGWGSLVVTNNTYLLQAGPAGSVIGMIIGALVMIVISRNYHYMVNSYPDAGGAYTYSKEVFGFDHGFLTAWFLALTYLSIFWANVTSLPLFAHYFLGNTFRFGFLYRIFDYDVYLGEALLSMAAIALTAFVCTRSKKTILNIMVGLVLIFTVGITVCFIAAMFSRGGASHSFEPAFIPDKNVLTQIIKIACISPWAFIGYENISHASEEFTFSRSKVFKILVISVIVTSALYIFVILLSVTAYPPEYSSWMEYIQDLGNLDGIKGLPAFYAAWTYMGDVGVALLIAALFALIVTSLFGNTLALSRLFYALAKDNVIPGKFAQLNKRNIPWRTFLLTGAVSILIPFLGRTAIGWIVDVTTIGATMIYAFVAAAAYKMAKKCGDNTDKAAGIAGVVLMILVGAFLMLPNLFSAGTMERETYFLFTLWAILGFIYFRYILSKDRENRFGRSTVVWIALLLFILFTSMVWLSQSTVRTGRETIDDVRIYYKTEYNESDPSSKERAFIANQTEEMRRANMRNIMTALGFFAISMSVMLSNYSLMRKRAQKSEEMLIRANNKVNIDPMTGVKSRHAFAEKEREINERISAKTIGEFAIAVCDVNGLKHINDTQGHKAGDEYIRMACQLICEKFDHSPVYRVGGDEFFVILTGRDYTDRTEIMKELNIEVEKGINGEGVVISVGMSEFDETIDKNLREVIERADALMYVRKKHLKALGARMRI